MRLEFEALQENESDDDFDWEEVIVPVNDFQRTPATSGDLEAGEGASTPRPNIEITIHTKPKKDDTEKKRRAALQVERVNRLNCHKAHTIILLGNAYMRNKWINDPLLHARLMSLVPMKLQTGLVIHKSRVPEAAMRGRMFESAVVHLVDWWCRTFDVLPYGHLKNHTYEEIQKDLLEKMERDKDRKGKRRAIDEDEDEDDDGDDEVVRSEKSLMKHALQRRGCRDTSSQLFTALCRALGVPARLIVSLQSVPWQRDGGKPKSQNPAKKPSERGEETLEEGEESDTEEVGIPSSPATNDKGEGESFPGTGNRLDSASPPDKGKGKQKALPVINLRKDRGRKLGSAPVIKRERSPDPLRSAPVFWTEVFSRADARWLPVDPIRGLVNKRKMFDPSSSINNLPNTKVRNRMVYVLAFEEDGYARDVTARYATEYGAKVSKLQQGGRGKKEWWERVVALVRRPYRLNRDDLEDEELHVNQMTEHMPTTMGGFKDHPLYVLARHLKRDEVIHPPVELGKFRGEPVYPRSSVIPLKTAENWMRQGRNVREGCQPMKWVKQRAVTVNKKRAIEMALADRHDRAGAHDQGDGSSSEKDIMQGLYAFNQTELYQPGPVVNGKVPKNRFGNIDLYVPSMLPAGGVHIPHKSVWKIAKQLGIDYAEAVTGFEFRKRRALPVITGIVVAKENEETVLEAYRAAERDAEEKRKAKRQEQVIKRWQRLVQGLRIRQRLQEQYTDRAPQGAQVTVLVEDEQQAGGFFSAADGVVQPYVLPKSLHEVPQSPHRGQADESENEEARPEDKEGGEDAIGAFHLKLTAQDEGEDGLKEVAVPVVPTGKVLGAPKTMRELAEDAERQHSITSEKGDEEEEIQLSSPARASSFLVPVSPTNGRQTRRSGRTPSSSTNAEPAKTSASKVTLRLSSRSMPRRARKRARGDSDSDTGHGGGVESEEEVAEPPPAKRTRRGTDKIKATLAPVPKSDRVLRSRAPKDAAKLQEEKEQKKAYRRAIAN